MLHNLLVKETPYQNQRANKLRFEFDVDTWQITVKTGSHHHLSPASDLGNYLSIEFPHREQDYLKVYKYHINS